VLGLLQELGRRTYVSVEYGLQTIHDRSLDWMNRGHHHDATIDAVYRSRGRGFEICGHVILGLPGESPADMLATAREIARLNLDAVKIHNLYAVKNTPLAEQVERGEVTLIEQADYIRTLIDFLELLPPEMIVERIRRRPARLFRRPLLVPRQTRHPSRSPARARPSRHLAGQALRANGNGFYVKWYAGSVTVLDTRPGVIDHDRVLVLPKLALCATIRFRRSPALGTSPRVRTRQSLAVPRPMEPCPAVLAE
jgi:radical SAM superfamily enzyme YgiQ (UPF0313 family)